MLRIIQLYRDTWGAAICIDSNAVYRRVALVPMLHWGHAPCRLLRRYLYKILRRRKWLEIKYIPLVLACGLCPDTPHASSLSNHVELQHIT